MESSWSATRAKDSIFAVRFYRWQRTLGKKKASVAVCHAMLKVIYFVLKEKISFIAVQVEMDQHQQRARQIRHHCRRLRELGIAPEMVQQAMADQGVAAPEPKHKGSRRKGALGLKAY